MAKSRKSSSRSRRRQQRTATRPPAPRPSEPMAPLAGMVEDDEPATAAAERRPAARTTAAPRPSRANTRLTVAGPSALSERAIEEYHYVGRDLRNIFTLVVIMAVLLAVAFVAFTALGIGHTT